MDLLPYLKDNLFDVLCDFEDNNGFNVTARFIEPLIHKDAHLVFTVWHQVASEDDELHINLSNAKTEEFCSFLMSEIEQDSFPIKEYFTYLLSTYGREV